MNTTGFLTSSLALTMMAAALAGCANPVVATGDRVEVVFTCRLPGGELAATTKPDSDIGDERKSAFYLPRSGPETVMLTAGAQTNDGKRDRISFEDEIMKRLGDGLPGLKVEQQKIVELQAERYPATSPRDRFVRMAKVRKRQKELRLSREEYVARTGKSPELGQRLVIDPLVPGRVSEVTDREVVVLFAPEPGKPLTSPFGPIKLSETATQYELEINAKKDRLLRTGGMAGRISDVDNDSFEIDYGHPFGGEKLSCELTVVSLKPAEQRPGGQEPVAASADSLDPRAVKALDEGLARMLSTTGQPPVTNAAASLGDLVTVNYTVTLEDGALVATTLEKIARDQAQKRVAWFHEQAGYAPQELVAGQQADMPGLGEALVGLRAGEKRRIRLPADKAFGMPDPLKTQQLPCSQSFPKTVRMPADEFARRFSTVPVLHSQVDLLPYFKSRVTEVTGNDVALEFQAVDGTSFNDGFGSIGVAVVGDLITTTLKPLPGAPFPLKDGVGIVSATDGISFTVDFNHPLAGKSVFLDLEVVSVSKATADSTPVTRDAPSTGGTMKGKL